VVNSVSLSAPPKQTLAVQQFPLIVLDQFSVQWFRGESVEWAAVETKVSSSNFIFAAKNIVRYPRVPPADKNEIGTTDLGC
jgi:hypothetical protein